MCAPLLGLGHRLRLPLVGLVRRHRLEFLGPQDVLFKLLQRTHADDREGNTLHRLRKAEGSMPQFLRHLAGLNAAAINLHRCQADVLLAGERPDDILKGVGVTVHNIDGVHYHIDVAPGKDFGELLGTVVAGDADKTS